MKGTSRKSHRIIADRDRALIEGRSLLQKLEGVRERKARNARTHLSDPKRKRWTLRAFSKIILPNKITANRQYLAVMRPCQWHGKKLRILLFRSEPILIDAPTRSLWTEGTAGHAATVSGAAAARKWTITATWTTVLRWHFGRPSGGRRPSCTSMDCTSSAQSRNVSRREHPNRAGLRQQD